MKTTKRPKNRKAIRQPHQRKASTKDESGKGKKCLRGEPEYYNELKAAATFSLTPTAKAGLNSLSQTRSISMSELIERIGRKIIKLADEESSDDI